MPSSFSSGRILVWASLLTGLRPYTLTYRLTVFKGNEIFSTLSVGISSTLSKHLYRLIFRDIKKGTLGTTMGSSWNYPATTKSYIIIQEAEDGSPGWQAAVNQRFQHASGSLTGTHAGQIVSSVSIQRQPITGTHLHPSASPYSMLTAGGPLTPSLK